jgi:hypothetical protein
MELGQIGAIDPIEALAPAGEAGPRLPAAGRELRVAVQLGADGGFNGLTEDGLLLMLPGLAEAGVLEGDVLRLRVLQGGAAPRVELLGVEQPAKATPQSSAEAPDAPQLPRAADPTVFSQIGWQRPTALQLANGWRLWLLGRLAGAALLSEQAQGQHLSASLLQALPSPEALLADTVPDTLPDPTLGWLSLLAWQGQTVRLGIEADEEALEHGREWDAVDLLLEAELPGLGWILLRLSPTRAGLLLTITVESPEAVQRLRSQSILLKLARRAGIRLQGWSLKQGKVQDRPSRPPLINWQRAARQLEQEPFLLAAEVMLALAEIAGETDHSLNQGI